MRNAQLKTLTAIDLVVLNHSPANFSVAEAETVCLSGPSGSGKSMLLRAMADLIPHQGDVRLGEMLCSQTLPHVWRRQVAYLPAESFWWADTVGEHFVPRAEGEAFSADFVSLGFEPDVFNWQIARLSSGERQRLAILRLLANEPRALLLDEPTANLDTVNIERVERLISRYQQQQHCPVLWVSHDPAQLQRLARRVLLLKNGHIMEASP